MRNDLVNRPEPEAICRLLQSRDGTAAATAVRLAWQAGLMREELVRLTWPQVDLENGVLRLARREVPLEPPLRAYLSRLYDARDPAAPPQVILSERLGKPVTPQYLSALVRCALDAEGQRSVRLLDLRHDYVIRQLERHDWQYVSRVCGIQAAALNQHFAAYLPAKRISTRVDRDARRAGRRAQIDEVRLWRLIRGTLSTPVGLGLALTWQMGLTLGQIAALRWEQVDLRAGTLRLDGAPRSLPAELRAALEAQRPAGGGNVLLTPRSRRPFDTARLSKIIRAALVSAGLDDLTLYDLRLDHKLRLTGERRILEQLQRTGSIMRRDVVRLLGVSPSTASARLRRMTERGLLTPVGMKYYPANTVVPPERQKEVILQYLSEADFAYRQDIAGLLHVEARQCGPILRRMVAEGVLRQEKQRYYRRYA